ncbi:MAG: hypothetical protein R6U04_02655 [Bacteroidales bacterium]
MEQEKKLLKKDVQAADNELFEAKSILGTISKLKEWYKKNELDFNFSELKKIAFLKKEELRPFFWAKFKIDKFPKMYRKSFEKEVSGAVQDVLMKLSENKLRKYFQKFDLQAQDIDLNKVEFTKKFREKLEEIYSYYLQNEDEAAVWEMLESLAEQGLKLKKLISEKFGVEYPVFLNATGRDIWFFVERLDKSEIEPNASAILSLRNLKKGRQNNEKISQEMREINKKIS